MADIEPPFGDIWDGLRAGRVIPFLGAGASIVGRAEGAAWRASEAAFLPSGRELAHFLAERSNFPSQDPADVDDLAKVASYTADVSGRAMLRQRLRTVFNHPYRGSPLHAFLADVTTPLLIVVTNYDTLLEQAFQAAGKPYDLVVYPADRAAIGNALLWWPHGQTDPVAVEAKELDLDLERTTVIYKMHGTLWPASETWDNFVITEEDYVEFLSRMTTNSSSAVPAQFYQYSRQRSFLFLGYSLHDWNLRVVLRNLRRQFETMSGSSDGEDVPSWAIQRRPSPLERRLWSRRRVDIFDMEIDQFVGKLADWKRRD